MKKEVEIRKIIGVGLAFSPANDLNITKKGVKLYTFTGKNRW